MSLTRRAIENLAEKKLLGTISPEEDALLNKWLQTHSGTNRVNWNSADMDEQTLHDRLLRRILADAGIERKYRRRSVIAFVGSAAAIVLLAIGFTFYLQHYPKTMPPATATMDIAPGQNGAVLTLADGRKMPLDSAGNGIIATQQSSRIMLSNGKLYYKTNDMAPGAQPENISNTVSTPNGRQFQMTLSDGTGVWLNAGSSIQYPVAFNGSTREVTVTGEAYFEVAKQTDASGKRRAFIVKAGRQQITVLGTHFDVNAYTDEPFIKTTLLEGRVQLSATGAGPVILAPGQQGILKNGNSKIAVKTVDAVSTAAWTQGMFSFSNASIEEVMRQLARWYNVQVIYAPDLPKRTFSGKIYRNLSAARALDALQFMNLHFKIEDSPQGMRIQVMP